MTFLISAFSALTTSGSIGLAFSNLAGVAVQSIAAAGIGGILAGTGAIFGAISAVQAGQAESARNNFEAGQLAVEGKAAAANAKREENQAREQLLKTLASTNAAASAAGIDIASGSVQSGREAAFRQANREISTVRSDQEIQQLQRQGKITQLRINAKMARKQGRADAVVGLTATATRNISRG